MNFKKDDGSSFLHIVIVWTVFTIAIVITIYLYALNLISAVKTQTENDLEIANLSAATINIKHYTETGEFVITDIKKAYTDFIYTFKVNMGLVETSSNLFNPRFGSYYNGIISNIFVHDFIVYNIIDDVITENRYDISSDSIQTITYVLGTPETLNGVKTPDGAEVINPTVYSRVDITLTLPGHINKTINRENSVAIVIDQ